MSRGFMSSRFITFNILPLSQMSVSTYTRMTWYELKQLLSINEKTEGCLHEVFSLKGDASVHGMRILCHACLKKRNASDSCLHFFFYWVRVVVGAYHFCLHSDCHSTKITLFGLLLMCSLWSVFVWSQHLNCRFVDFIKEVDVDTLTLPSGLWITLCEAFDLTFETLPSFGFQSQKWPCLDERVELSFQLSYFCEMQPKYMTTKVNRDANREWQGRLFVG